MPFALDGDGADQGHGRTAGHTEVATGRDRALDASDSVRGLALNQNPALDLREARHRSAGNEDEEVHPRRSGDGDGADAGYLTGDPRQDDPRTAEGRPENDQRAHDAP